MSEFDYEAAWNELAKPAVAKLSMFIIGLVFETTRLCGSRGQNSELGMDWPASEDGRKLEADFNSLSVGELALASLAVYTFGHWAHGPRDKEWEPVFECGGHWKFSKLCDQVIAEKIGNGVSGGYRAPKEGGLSFYVSEGKLYAQVSIKDEDCRVCMGVATLALHDRVLAEGLPKLTGSPHIRSDRERHLDKCRAWLEGVRDAFVKDFPECGDWDTSRFMVPDGTLRARHDKIGMERRLAQCLADPFFERRLMEGLVNLSAAFGHDYHRRTLEQVKQALWIGLGLPDEWKARFEEALCKEAPEYAKPRK